MLGCRTRPATAVLCVRTDDDEFLLVSWCDLLGVGRRLGGDVSPAVQKRLTEVAAAVIGELRSDELERFHRPAWSVFVVVCRVWSQGAGSVRTSCRPGNMTQWFRVVPASVTGRRTHLSDHKDTRGGA